MLNRDFTTQGMIGQKIRETELTAHAKRKDQMVKQPAISHFAELGWNRGGA